MLHGTPQVLVAAIGLAAPDQAVEWHKKYLARIDNDDLNIISPARPWMMLAHVLRDEPRELWEFLQKELLHTWVIDREDF